MYKIEVSFSLAEKGVFAAFKWKLKDNRQDVKLGKILMLTFHGNAGFEEGRLVV